MRNRTTSRSTGIDPERRARGAAPAELARGRRRAPGHRVLDDGEPEAEADALEDRLGEQRAPERARGRRRRAGGCGPCSASVRGPSSRVPPASPPPSSMLREAQVVGRRGHEAAAAGQRVGRAQGGLAHRVEAGREAGLPDRARTARRDGRGPPARRRTRCRSSPAGRRPGRRGTRRATAPRRPRRPGRGRRSRPSTATPPRAGTRAAGPPTRRSTRRGRGPAACPTRSRWRGRSRRRRACGGSRTSGPTCGS